MIKPLCILTTATCAALASQTAFADFHWTAEQSEATTSRIEAGEFGTITSVLILSDGQPVYEAYFNGADADTRHNTRSVTKTITGMLVGLAAGDGALDPSAPLAPLFRDEQPFANDHPMKQEITAYDLLTMSGPLECDDWNQFSRGNEERMYIVEDWPSFFWDLPVRGYPSWATGPDDAPYGRAFSYCTAGVQVLGDAVARATGQDIQTYAQERLFTPLGVTNPGWAETASGRVHLGGGLELTARDLAAFGEVQRQSGFYNGEQILFESWAEYSVTPMAEIEGMGFQYGLLWWLQERDTAAGSTQVAMMSGNGGNRVWVVDEHDLTIVLTKTDFNSRDAHPQSLQFFQQIIAPNLH